MKVNTFFFKFGEFEKVTNIVNAINRFQVEMLDELEIEQISPWFITQQGTEVLYRKAEIHVYSKVVNGIMNCAGHASMFYAWAKQNIDWDFDTATFVGYLDGVIPKITFHTKTGLNIVIKWGDLESDE